MGDATSFEVEQELFPIAGKVLEAGEREALRRASRAEKERPAEVSQALRRAS